MSEEGIVADRLVGEGSIGHLATWRRLSLCWRIWYSRSVGAKRRVRESRCDRKSVACVGRCRVVRVRSSKVGATQSISFCPCREQDSRATERLSHEIYSHHSSREYQESKVTFKITTIIRKYGVESDEVRDGKTFQYR